MKPAFVLDSSVTLAWFFRDECDDYAENVACALIDNNAVVSSMWPVEVTNHLYYGFIKKRSTRKEAQSWLEHFPFALISVDEPPDAQRMSDILALCHTCQLTAYDASFVELALRYHLPLATLDKKLRTKAQKAGVALFEPSI